MKEGPVLDDDDNDNDDHDEDGDEDSQWNEPACFVLQKKDTVYIPCCWIQ